MLSSEILKKMIPFMQLNTLCLGKGEELRTIKYNLVM